MTSQKSSLLGSYFILEPYSFLNHNHKLIIKNFIS